MEFRRGHRIIQGQVRAADIGSRPLRGSGGNAQMGLILDARHAGKLDLSDHATAERVIAVAAPKLDSYYVQIERGRAAIDAETLVYRGKEVSMSPAAKERRESEIAMLTDRSVATEEVLKVARTTLGLETE